MTQTYLKDLDKTFKDTDRVVALIRFATGEVVISVASERELRAKRKAGIVKSYEVLKEPPQQKPEPSPRHVYAVRLPGPAGILSLESEENLERLLREGKIISYKLMEL